MGEKGHGGDNLIQRQTGNGETGNGLSSPHYFSFSRKCRSFIFGWMRRRFKLFDRLWFSGFPFWRKRRFRFREFDLNGGRVLWENLKISFISPPDSSPFCFVFCMFELVFFWLKLRLLRFLNRLNFIVFHHFIVVFLVFSLPPPPPVPLLLFTF